MKTIKIIDLFIKIKNNEIKQGTKFKMLGHIYIYNNGYIAKTDANETIGNFYISQRMLNDEVEIIEEEKEIEKCDVLKHCVDFTKNENILLDNQLGLQKKINELIDVVNELKRGN